MILENEGRSSPNVIAQVKSHETDDTERDKLVQFDKTPEETSPYPQNYFTNVSAIS